MGKGKGAPEGWVAVVKPGRILYEMEGVDRADGQGGAAAGRRQDRPIKTRFVTRHPRWRSDEEEGAARRSRELGAGGPARRRRSELKEAGLEAAPPEGDRPAGEPEPAADGAPRHRARQDVRASARAGGEAVMEAEADERRREATKVGRVVSRQDAQDDRRRGRAARPATARVPADDPQRTSRVHGARREGRGASRRPRAHRGDAARCRKRKRWRLVTRSPSRRRRGA